MAVLDTYTRTYNPRRTFNPASMQDLRELKHFIETHSWKEACPFELEEPFLEIPAMCMSRYTEYMLTKLKA
jgi:hypothetical protein